MAGYKGGKDSLYEVLDVHRSASAKDIELPPLSPYSAKYAGYGIEKGKLSMEVKYKVEDQKLQASNHLFLDQLTFGDKVESPDATSLPVNLAISLHAADDNERLQIMPVNKKHKIKDIIDACRYYVDQTGRRVTFEWALINGVNDSPEIARKLASRLKGLMCHVNAIPLNPTTGYNGQATSRERAAKFKESLEQAGIPFVRFVEGDRVRVFAVPPHPGQRRRGGRP